MTLDQHLLGWIRAGNTKCRFARRIAASAVRTGQLRSLAIGGSNPSKRQLSRFDKLIEKALESSLVDACLAVFPNISIPAESARLIATLCRSKDWYCVNLLPHRTDALYIGLRRILPGNKYVSMTLGLADFPSMPETRRAPNVAILLRTGAPGTAIAKARGARKTQTKTVGASTYESVNLADMNADFYRSDEFFLNDWNKTSDDVKEIKLNLPREVSKILHEVSFVLPNNTRPILETVFQTETSSS